MFLPERGERKDWEQDSICLGGGKKGLDSQMFLPERGERKDWVADCICIGGGKKGLGS